MIELASDAPDLEDLAAYLDGRLSDERRAQVEARLARDEDYYDVFMETVRFQEEQSQEEGDGSVVTPAWWRDWKTMAPLAVAATLVTALGLQNLTPRSSVALIPRLDQEAVVQSQPERWDHLRWWRSRGGSTGHEPDVDLLLEQQQAFRIGSRIVDLEIALAAEDRGAAGEAAGELNHSIANVVLLSSLNNDYQDLQDEIRSREIDSLREEAEKLREQLMDMLDSSLIERFEFGVWNEVGRLAALSNDGEVLREIWQRRSSDQSIQETIEPRYEALQEALEAEENIDFKAAEAEFQKIAWAFAGQG